MRTSQLRLIFGILLAGAVVYGLILLVGSRSGGDDESAGFRLDVDSTLVSVRILDGPTGDTVRLARDGASWTVNGHRADSLKAAELVAALGGAETSQLIARNPDNHARLGVTAEDGRTVIMSDGNVERVFLLGTRELASGGYHVRWPDSAAVYRLSGPVGGTINRDLDNWRPRDIASVDTAAVREILVRRDGEESVISRQDEGWTVGATAADSATIDDLLRIVSALRASGFPTDSAAAAADFDAGDGALELYGGGEEGGGERTLLLSLRFVSGADDTEPWLLRAAGDPEIYQVTPVQIRRLLPPHASWLGEEES